MSEFANVLSNMFFKWRDLDEFDVDITTFLFLTRKLVRVFTSVIECSCESVGELNSNDVTRAVAAPLFTNTTDTLLNGLVSMVFKAV